MNKHCYRIVFNPKRGILMAVFERARGQGKGSGGARTRSRLRLAGLLPFLFAPVVQAQIVANPNAPAHQQPVVTSAPNGVPLVNIQTPSAAGVSHNSYQRFDVQTPGAILNNSAGNTSTQLGGWVQGNPALSGGEARVILNEVNASNPSQLRGFVEVAGGRAQVVIANPAGVTCDGCGFINASRATLTTGTPVVNDRGQLEGYRVQRGTVTITGQGLDARSADYTDILARAVDVQAALRAQKLKIITGTQRVDLDSAGDPSPGQALAGEGDAPAVGIDTAALGGMYANQITLIATEAGAGIRNAGQLYAGVGDVLITAAGELQNQAGGRIVAQGDTRIRSQQLTNRGLIDGKQTRIDTQRLTNTGTGKIYGDHLAIAAQTLTNSAEGGLAGTLAARMQLDLAVTWLDNTGHALIYSGGNLSIG
ncbi:MAG: filamentous hemagglutinin N-terminal domain-containing protein, partial [Azoarcus sp.]|nr:filamentous hemagglutinin N-terminal domain-containing protein [Azoarcus sp.]